MDDEIVDEFKEAWEEYDDSSFLPGEPLTLKELKKILGMFYNE